ncbi:MAG: ATP-binding protein [Candidatus Riflebacteria bacterium]|nr:ATP-binding protein [Candidatus Riflebacteria bacterium]
MRGYFPRAIEDAVRRAASSFPALVVTGPRQSGKTWLLRHLFDGSHSYVSLDDPDLELFASSDPRGFLEDHRPPVVLDEIQRAPTLLRHVKMAVDAARHEPGRFILTGSQTFSLMAGVTESLAGRSAVLHLLPLSTAENPGRRAPPVRDRETYARWVLTGSFPELHHRPGLDARTWYASYLQTYLERDVRTLANVGNLRDFNRLLHLLAGRTGGIVNLSWLARDVGVAVNTIKSWLSVLEASGVVHLCPGHHGSQGKRVAKNPRIHFLDPGTVVHLAGMRDVEQVLNGPMAGSLFETFVAGEILRLQARDGLKPTLFHWRDYGGHEVDLVLESGGRVHGIECKLASSVSDRDTRALELFLSTLPARLRGTGLLICTAPAAGRLRDVRVLPVTALSDASSMDDLLR